MPPRPYRRFNAQHAAGALAKKVWECSQCEAHYYQRQQKKPAQCIACGCMRFIEIPSETQATRWATLRRAERAGTIINLRREVPYRLVAFNKFLGLPAEVGWYICDAVYEMAEVPGVEILEETKPKVGVDDLADLKIRWMKSMGYNIVVWMPRR